MRLTDYDLVCVRFSIRFMIRYHVENRRQLVLCFNEIYEFSLDSLYILRNSACFVVYLFFRELAFLKKNL